MKIVEESPLDFANGDDAAKAGNIYYDGAMDLWVYWVDTTTWAYIPGELARAWGGDANKIDSLAQEVVRLQAEQAQFISVEETETRPLNPEDIVDMRGTCTVDELLRMREAGLV